MIQHTSTTMNEDTEVVMNSASTLEIRFVHSGETLQVGREALDQAVTSFLELYGEESFLGKEFCAMLQGASGREKFDSLLRHCGLDAEAFFTAVLKQLEEANHVKPRDIVVAGVPLPKKFMLCILEQVIPGNGFVSVKSVPQYELLTNTAIPEEQRQDLQKVMDKYPVRLSRHVIRLSRLSRDVAYQFMPFVEELDESGHKNTWIGQFHQGLLEQMYQNRPIFVLHMSCPVYCRFCFRKHKDCRNLPTPSTDDVGKALQYIAGAKDIKEIVLTGGEPLMNKDTLTCAVEGLGEMSHIQTIRIASRCISYYPDMFYKDESFWLRYLIEKNAELVSRGKRIEVATHFIHPDEVSHYSLDIISQLVRGGISVYTQTPFLKDCNDSGVELVELYRQLRGAGSEMHYIYIPCSPIQGNNVYWTDIAQGHKAAIHLRAHLSDRAMPIICTATRIGKIDWNTSGWAVQQDQNNPDDIWIRTPYSENYFRKFAPNFSLMSVKANRNGTLDAPFMAKIGDTSLFLGHLEDATEPEAVLDADRLAEAQELVQADGRIQQGMVSTGLDSLQRIHETRVELDVGAVQDFDRQIASIAADERITDVVAAAQDGLLGRLDAVERLATALKKISHVNALRLRSLEFTYQPARFTNGVIERIADCNALAVVNPLRLEIEAQFLHSSEFRDIHTEIIKAFLKRGVTVYSNIVLLSDVNDNPDEMKKMCYKCRQIGIELYHLYVAGLPVQLEMNAALPVEASDVIHIATHLRRHESGRELPLYVVRTALGDVDFNLTGIPVGADEASVSFALRPYGLEYYRALDPSFCLPEDVNLNADGAPVVPVRGITVRKNKAFFLRE